METQTEIPERKAFRCKRCGWLWVSKLDNPVVCPKCHSPYWNIPKETKLNK